MNVTCQDCVCGHYVRPSVVAGVCPECRARREAEYVHSPAVQAALDAREENIQKCKEREIHEAHEEAERAAAAVREAERRRLVRRAVQHREDRADW